MSTVLGERLIMLRKEKNLTQKQLAEELMCSATRLNYWEKGKCYPKAGVAFGRYENGSRESDNVTLGGIADNIKPTSLKKIADYFDVSCDFLLGRTNCRKNATLHDFSLEELLNEILIRLGR